MNGVVIALVLLMFLLVIGAVIYFSMQENEEKDDDDLDDEYIPVETITETPSNDDSAETETDTFDIVNGWLYDTKYSKMIGVGADGKMKISSFDSENPDQRSKWTFEPSGSSFYILDESGKALKITGSDVQLGAKSGSAKIKIVPTDDGYKLSNSSGRNWALIEGSSIKVTKEESRASTFLIEASQYYIKSFQTDKYSSDKYTEENKKGLIDSLSNFDIKCDTGVISGFGLVKDGSKYKYKYGCVEGEAATGDLLESTLLKETTLEGVGGFHGGEAGGAAVAEGFKVDCDREGGTGGALARFKLLKGDGTKAHYEYSCRDVSTTGDPKSISGPKTVDADYSYKEDETYVDPIVEMGSLNCGQGDVLTGFEFTHNAQQGVGISGICKKLAA